MCAQSLYLHFTADLEYVELTHWVGKNTRTKIEMTNNFKFEIIVDWLEESHDAKRQNTLQPKQSFTLVSTARTGILEFFVFRSYRLSHLALSFVVYKIFFYSLSLTRT